MSIPVVFGIALPKNFGKKEVELCALSSFFHLLQDPEYYYLRESETLSLLGSGNRKFVPYFLEMQQKLQEKHIQLKSQQVKMYSYGKAKYSFELHPETIKVLGHYLATMHAAAPTEPDTSGLLENHLEDFNAERLWLAKSIQDHYQQDPIMAERQRRYLDDSYKHAISIMAGRGDLPSRTLTHPLVLASSVLLLSATAFYFS